MRINTLSILVVSALIAGAGISNADAAAMRPAQPQYQTNDMDSWLSANGRMAIRLQSGDNQHHHHGDGAHLSAHDADAHDSSASSNSASSSSDSSSSHSGGSHGGGRR